MHMYPGEEQRGRERISIRLPAEHVADAPARCRAQSHDPDTMTQAQIKSRMPKQLNHPGAP